MTQTLYSEEATKFCEIFTLLLSNLVPVKSKVKISQYFVAFSEYMNSFEKFRSKLSCPHILQKGNEKVPSLCLEHTSFLVSFLEDMMAKKFASEFNRPLCNQYKCNLSMMHIFFFLGSLLLESKIQPDTAYQKQQETLIVWSEGENYDLALSFQEKAGCDEIWEKICQVNDLTFFIKGQLISK